jgi:hypothetical protein
MEKAALEHRLLILLVRQNLRYPKVVARLFTAANVAFFTFFMLSFHHPRERQVVTCDDVSAGRPCFFGRE